MKSVSPLSAFGSAIISASLLFSSALAQGQNASEQNAGDQGASERGEASGPASAPVEEDSGAVDPDESADLLNSQQQLKQTFTLKRRIDGQVVETTKKTVTLSPGIPYRPTEAGESVAQQLLSTFDNEVLTRVEAFEEAKLDFTIADIDRNRAMTADEFIGLVESWRAMGRDSLDSPEEDMARQRQYDALGDALDPATDKAPYEAYAKAKFDFITGASQTLSQEDYIREYLRDFDAMDVDNDMLLEGDELLRFRAANRGETLEF